MKIIFAGTTEFGIPTLEKLSTINYPLLTIITQPDKPVGRKKVLTPPAIKIWAEKNNIPVLQPTEIRNSKSEIRNLHPDLLLVAAYGQIIPKEILDIPKYGSINIHASLLPKYRGASPIQAAILNGDKTTGITLIKMDEKMDHGPLLAQQTITIDDNYLALHQKLSVAAADLIAKTLPDWFAGRIIPKEQDHSQATFTKLLGYADGRLDWTKPAPEISRKIRAFNPEPGTWTTFEGKAVKILQAKTLADGSVELPGKIISYGKSLAVKCQSGLLEILLLQPDGKKPMSGQDFLNGLKSKQTAMFV